MERGEAYICFCHLGLISCMTPLGVISVTYAHTICDEPGKPMQVSLPDELEVMPAPCLHIVLAHVFTAFFSISAPVLCIQLAHHVRLCQVTPAPCCDKALFHPQ